jgi:hypothetical protein
MVVWFAVVGEDVEHWSLDEINERVSFVGGERSRGSLYDSQQHCE